MAKKTYLVTRGGVLGLTVGQRIQRENLHPSLEAHVTLVPDEKEDGGGAKLEVGKPLNATEKKAIIGKRLEELGIVYSADLSVVKMLELLPAGEAEAIFPK